MWVGGRRGGGHGWVSFRETMQWSVEPRLPCPTRGVFFFPFCFWGGGEIEQLRFPIIFLNHVVPSFESYQYLKLTNCMYRLVRPVVAGEDRLRFAKSIFSTSTACLERGRWNCKFYTTTIFFIEILSIQCVVGSPVNLLCTLLWETVETIYNIWEYKRTASNHREEVFLFQTKQEVPFYFQMSSLRHQRILS